MVYRSSMPNDANGREMSCPYCGTKNDRDRPTCWSCGKPLKTGVARQPATAGKKAVIAVEMPMSYTVLTVFAYIDVILGLVCCRQEFILEPQPVGGLNKNVRNDSLSVPVFVPGVRGIIRIHDNKKLSSIVLKLL